MQTAALCQALPLSAHTAPSFRTHLCCALEPVCHVEYFHDHARIEQLLFDGALTPSRGMLVPDLSRSGAGIALKQSDASRYAVPF